MRILSFKELKTMKGIDLSKPTLWRLVQKDKFPKPLKLGSGPNSRNCWAESEIDTWLTDKLAERDDKKAA